MNRIYISGPYSLLTRGDNRGYSAPVTSKKGVIGIAISNGAAKSRYAVASGFFTSVRPAYGRPGGRSRKARRCSIGIATPVSVARPFAMGLAVNNRNWSAIMTNTTIGAVAPAIFNFRDTTIRTFADDHQNPWFLASDVCKILGYSNPSKTVADHCRTPGITKRYMGVSTGQKSDGSTATQQVEATYINEGNLYRLIVKSRKPEAEKFEAWVMEEVLPAIRKTGSYSQQAPSLANRRWLISFDHMNREVIQEIDWNDCLLKYEDLPKLLAASDNMLPSALLADIASACVQRLARQNANLTITCNALRQQTKKAVTA